MAYKGYFKPVNPHKYNGNPTQIVYRSLWEMRVMNYLDHHPHVVAWESELLAIPYRSKIDGRRHKYYPDFKVKFVDKDKKTRVMVIEVKPLEQRSPPKTSNRKTKKYIKEVVTYGINISKWAAAEQYCKDRNWEFKILSEDEIYGKR